jgi:UDP-hydrolysing UDP-N-acetyl-D-glucosamine 2-epimerase
MIRPITDPGGADSGKRKICVVVASRANYGRIKSTMQAVQAHSDLQLQLVVAASAMLDRYGGAIDVIRRDGFEPNAVAYLIIEGENPTTMAKSTGLATIELATIFENLQPDIVVTVADRFETMATAIAASYMNIPLAHTQGGEVSGSIDESVRHAITRLAHVHFPATERSRQRLLAMGEDPATVHWVGCPAMDLAARADREITDEFIAAYAGRGVGQPVDFRKPYVVVIQHPVTTEYGNGLHQIEQTLHAIEDLDQQVVWLWPNVDAGSDEIAKGIRVFREHHRCEHMHFFRNFPPEDYVRLIANCRCLIGNSSSALREGSFLGIPAVNVGTRQRGREHGSNLVHAGYDAADIRAQIDRQLDHGPYEPDHIFGDGHAGEKMADVLATCEPNLNKVLHL